MEDFPTADSPSKTNLKFSVFGDGIWATDRSKHVHHPLPQNPASFDGDPEQHSQPHERVQRVKPCRTLFVRNIAYEADSALIRTPFESYGELANFFDLIKRRGMCFITYFDVRAAESAFNAMQGSHIGGRPLDVHYSLPQADETSQPCDRGKHQGTLSVWLESCTEPINDSALSDLFEQYGQVKDIRDYDDRSDSRYVEFFDERSALAAFDNLNMKPWLDGTLNLYFEWDCPMVSAPKKSGGYADKMGAEHLVNNPPRDFSAAALNESASKSAAKRSRRGGQRRSKNRRGDSISDGPGVSGVSGTPSAPSAPRSYGHNSNESNVRNAYSNRQISRPPQPQQHYGGYLPATLSSTPAPYNAANAYGTTLDTSRLADAQRVQALLSSLNPSTLNMNMNVNPSVGGAAVGAGAGAGAGAMQMPTHAPAPAHTAHTAPPMMPTPPFMQPTQPPYYASQSPPLGMQPHPHPHTHAHTHTPHAPQPPQPQPQQQQSSLPPNIMSILQAASSNVSGSGSGSVGGYAPAPVGAGAGAMPGMGIGMGGGAGAGYQSAQPNAPQQPMYNGYQTMQPVSSVPGMSTAGRDPRIQQRQPVQPVQPVQQQSIHQQQPVQPQQAPSEAPPNPQSVQALLSMLNSQ
ncbi:hypothetical protein E3P84_02198 [Wallemia ichthyophaga]|nr:hypothetical protein E3P84_02198 [Wallemia ichthyophaga]TIB41300.1 hypothetical protein E3P83_02151 [Wallemia ichthyophaga]